MENVEGIIPNMRTLITSVDDKFTVIRTLGVDVGKKIAELRRKVAVAREKANRWVSPPHPPRTADSEGGRQ